LSGADLVIIQNDNDIQNDNHECRTLFRVVPCEIVDTELTLLGVAACVRLR
jgi:hypothetical protein